MEVVKGTLENLDALAELFDQYRVWYRKESDLKAAKRFLSERITRKESEIFVVKLADHSLAGFTQCYPLFTSTKMRRLWLLNDLFVAAVHRGKGLSKALIEAAKNLARETNAAGILLETEKSNDIGNQLYPRTGFVLEENNFYFWPNS